MKTTRNLIGLLAVAFTLIATPRESKAQVTNVTNYFSTADASTWQVTGGGATNVIPWELTGQFAGFISVLSGADQGSYLPGITNFTGFWVANYAFTLPPGATNISLTYSNLYIDDRGMLYLNGQFILATGFASSNILNPGEFVYTDGGAPQSYDSFVATNAHLSGVINNGFISGGTNVLSVVINNTGTGTQGPDVAPTNTATHHDATVLNLSGAISYQLGPQISSGIYELVNANSGMVLDVQDQATTNGANIDQWIANGGGNQRWAITSLGNGQYEIANVRSGLALEVYNQSKVAGAAVDQWSYWGGANQKWSISSQGNGNFQILNVNSGLALEVTGQSLHDGTMVDQSGWLGGANQQWLILPVNVTGSVSAPSGGSGVAASIFHGFNWADPGDNFQDGPLLLSGLAIGDSYAAVEAKASTVLGAFQNVGADTVRIPINPETVLGSWWQSYQGIIDTATSMGMKVIVCVWTGSSDNNGMVNDSPAFFKMWDTVITAYNGNPNVYFEVLNEPFGYSATNWLNVVSNWLARYPTVERGRVLVGGTGYCQNIPAVASSGITAGCLFSVHDYGFWNSSDTSDSSWYNNLSGETGTHASRTVLTEFGAPMNKGWNYQGGDQGNNGIASVIGFCDFCHNNDMGSVYWPGLARGDGYSMFTLNTNTMTLSLASPSGMNLVQYGWGMTLPPATPVGLTAMGSDSLVVLSWSAANGATGYNLKRSLTSDGNYTVIATNLPGLAFTNSGLFGGTTYYYVVSAANVVGESADSAPVGVIPLSGVPANIFVTFGNGQLQISWPEDHTGWLLQAQTNSAPNGLGTNWVTLPGSGGTNQISVPIIPSSGSVFFRMVHP